MSKPARAEKQAVRPPTATEQVQALMELRRLQGLIVPMPAALPDAAVQYSAMEDTNPQKRQIEQMAYAWLKQTAERGAGQDVDAAWYSLDAKVLKEKLYNQYEQLRLQADRSFHALAEAAEGERQAAHRVWLRKQEVVKLKKQIEDDEKALEAKKQRLAMLT